MANIYGVLPVLEALRAGARRIDRIVVADGARVALDRLTHNANHQGVIAVTSAAAYSDADDLLSSISSNTIFILLDGVEDPHTLGAVIRTAECGGASAVIVPERRAAHITEAVAKTSAGAVEHLPVARVTNLASYIEDLKNHNIWVVGVESSGKMAYTEFNYSGALALVFGGEGHGLHRLVRERCDAVVSIPMR